MIPTLYPAAKLPADLVEAWSRLQRSDPNLDSPFFRPEYTQAIAAVRPDVEVAVMEDQGSPVAFFPFQRGAFGIGRPVGGPMTDFQGVIARPGLVWGARDLVSACRLASYDFDHLPAAQQAFQPHTVAADESPYLDLANGFEAYQSERNRSGSMILKDTLRKARKFEREAGPLRFEYHSADRGVLDALIRWKSAQYQRTEATDVFAFDWARKLVELTLSHTGEAFAGVLSALYVGDRLAAAHLGLRSYGVLHYWFPSYDVVFGKYSPGLILLLELARSGAAQGVSRLDLGRGEKTYKNSFRSAAVPLAEGCVSLRPLHTLVRRGWHGTRSWARSSRLGGPVRLAGKWTRTLRGWLAFR